jgi:CRP/FNR family transcriptional regulator, dissimilatory nitrate respiration regulator
LMEEARSAGKGLPESLMGIGRRREAGSGAMIFQQGAPAESCYYLESGEVALCRLSRSGSEVEIARAGEGEWFGEAIIFAGSAYPAQATARRDSRLVEFGRSAILGARDPEVSAFFLSLLAGKCLKLNRRIEQLAIMDVRERLVRYILDLCPGRAAGCAGEKSPCSVPFPKKKLEIAAELGMAPETFSRNLRQLEAEGLVLSRGRRIEVPSCVELLRLVDGD